jgi:hypothetical protein
MGIFVVKFKFLAAHCVCRQLQFSGGLSHFRADLNQELAIERYFRQRETHCVEITIIIIMMEFHQLQHPLCVSVSSKQIHRNFGVTFFNKVISKS